MTDTKLKYFITVPGRPIPRAVKFSKFGSYNTKRVRTWMDLVALLSKTEINSKGVTADKGIPVQVKIIIHMPLAKGTSKKAIAKEVGQPHVKIPDADNLIKPIKDALTEAGMWDDDCQVYDIQATKINAKPEEGRVEIAVLWTSQQT